MEQQIDVSIIIVNYNSADLILDCIQSIETHTKKVSYEMIVVDNASEASDYQKLQQLGNRIKLIPAGTNRGFGTGNNLASEHAEGKYLFFLNPDTILIGNAIQVLYSYISSNPDVGCVGANLLHRDMTTNFSYRLWFYTLKQEKKNSSWLFLLDPIGVIKNKFIKPKPHFENAVFNTTDEPLNVAWVSGAAMMIPSALFRELKGFDPDFFMYAEEVELQWRLSEKGYRRCNVPAAKIIHLEGETIKNEQRQMTWNLRGLMTYYDKRYGVGGAKKMYSLRKKRYKRLKLINILTHKDNTGINCLDSWIDDAWNNYLEFGGKNGGSF